MKTAIYPFSGDPITFGHIDVISRAAQIFDHVIAAVGNNPLKEYLFTIDERTQMACEALAHLANVEVAQYEGLLADFASAQHTNIIIRGIRNAEDFEFEWTVNTINESIDPGLETFWMPCRKEKAHISSSGVKKEWHLHHDLSGLVPQPVIEMLDSKSVA